MKNHGDTGLAAALLGGEASQAPTLLKPEQLHPQPIITTMPIAQLYFFTTDHCRDA